jgi:formylglycine-generating enzyme required for sulfatase activity
MSGVTTRNPVSPWPRRQALVRAADKTDPWESLAQVADNPTVSSIPTILEDSAQRTSLDERWAATRELGEADPRIGTLVRVPSGHFLRGSREGQGLPSERPQKLVDLPSFEIGIVPVTVWEFRQFVKHGYADRALWSEAGWSWKTENGIDRPRFWEEEEWAKYLEPNQPVVGVSWYEAEAFCVRTSRRLPTEAEWEEAARGPDGRNYPWGNEWIPANAAHRGGPRHTLPVGCFPAGVSPHGLLDAAGNVWEWVQDSYDAEAYQRPTPSVGMTGLEMKVARGGAWNALPQQLRCANRNAWRPGARFSNIGFRVAR